MKTKLLSLFIAVSAFALAANATTPLPPFKHKLPKFGTVSPTVYITDSVLTWHFDSVAQKWNAAPDVRTSQMTYDLNNNLTGEVISYDTLATPVANAWFPYIKYAYTVDANNNLASMTQQVYDFTKKTMVNNTYDGYLNDANGNNLTDTSKYWNGKSWNDTVLTINTYNAANKQLTTYTQLWTKGAWVNSGYKTINTYDVNNNIVEQETDSLYGNSSKQISITKAMNGYNASKELINDTIQQPTTQTPPFTTFADVAREFFKYDANGNQLRDSVQTSSTVRGKLTWTNYQLIVNTFNASNKQTSQKNYNWSTSGKGSWIISTYTYSNYDANNNLTLVVDRAYDATGKITIVTAGTTDSTIYYFHALNTGIAAVQNHESSVVVYPNPFSTTATLVFGEEQHNTSVSVVDIVGKQVSQFFVNGTTASLNKGNLNNGVYFLRIVDNNNQVTFKKIIIE